jgi:tetratricopeptide (TPR) repeat protein
VLYCEQRQYEQAELCYLRALSIYENVLGPEHPYIAASLNNLALLYRELGQYEQAQPLFQRALSINEKALGPDHRNALQVQKNYLDLLMKMKQKH